MTFLGKPTLSVTGENNRKYAKNIISRLNFKENILVILEMLECKSMICDSSAQLTLYDNSLKAIFSNIIENVTK